MEILGAWNIRSFSQMHKSHFRDRQTYFCHFVAISQLIRQLISLSLWIPIHNYTTQCSFTRFVSKRTFMVIVTFFESIFISTLLIFISSCTNRCFANKAFRKTVTIHRTVCFSTAIASFSERWCWIFHSFRIMFPDDIVYARRTIVT